LPFLKIDEKTMVSSTGALSLTEIPKKLIVVGGGVIGLEMGSVWSRLGSQVTVVEFLPAIAAGADGQVAKELQQILTKQGLSFLTETKVTGANKTNDGWKLSVETVKGEKERAGCKCCACIGWS